MTPTELKARIAALRQQHKNGDNLTRWTNRVLLLFAQIDGDTPDLSRVDAERVGWLRTLVASYRELRGQLDDLGESDEDPRATDEMLDAVTRLADELDPPRPAEQPSGPEPEPPAGEESIPF